MSRGHIRRQGKSSWEIKYDLEEDPTTRERRTKYVTFRGTKRDAEAELTRLLKWVDDGSHVEASKVTLADFAEYWLTDIAPVKAKSAKTLERYRELIDGHIIPQLGAFRLQKLQGSHIDALYSHLRTTGRKDGKGGLAEQTIIHIHRRLSALLSAAVSSGKLRTNPMDRTLARPASRATDRREVRVLDDEETKCVLDALTGTPYLIPTMVALGTGLRRGEVLGLKWKDIDFDSGMLTVARTLRETKAGMSLETPKTKHSRRIIKLPATLTAALQGHQRKQAEDYLRIGLRPELNLVFPSELGGLKSPDDFSWKYGQAIKRAGLTGVNFHALRHTHITNLLRSKMSIKAIATRAGHRDPTVTLQTYAHVMPGDDEDLAAVTDEVLCRVVG
jgi:integrase